jgi:hypothetical protein
MCIGVLAYEVSIRQLGSSVYFLYNMRFTHKKLQVEEQESLQPYLASIFDIIDFRRTSEY